MSSLRQAGGGSGEILHVELQTQWVGGASNKGRPDPTRDDDGI